MVTLDADTKFIICGNANMRFKNFDVTVFKGVGTPREAPKNVFWDVSVFSSDSGREIIAFASSMHKIV